MRTCAAAAGSRRTRLASRARDADVVDVEQRRLHGEDTRGRHDDRARDHERDAQPAPPGLADAPRCGARGSAGRSIGASARARATGRSWVGTVTMPPHWSRRRNAGRSRRGATRSRGARPVDVVHAPPHELDQLVDVGRPRAPGSATKKLACFSETTAPPTRMPLQPAASMRRPAESPGGLVNTEPAFCPPGWCSRRHRTISSMRAAHAPGSSGAPGERRAPPRPTRGRQRRVRYPRPSWARLISRNAAVAEIEDPRAEDHVVGLRAVAARVHAHRAADRARDPDEELEPGDARPLRVRRASTGKRDRAAAAHVRRHAGSRRGSTRRRRVARTRRASTIATPAKPSSATSRFEPRPITSTGTSRSRDDIGDDRGGRRRDSARTTTASGPPQRYVVSPALGTPRSHPTREPGRERRGPIGRRCSRRRARSSSAVRRPAEPGVGQPGEVAGAEGQHDVAGPRQPARARRPGRPDAGDTRPAASATRRPPRARPAGPTRPAIGVSPAGYTSVSTTASAPSNAPAKSRQSDAVRV